jgi:Holliday junction DNA helicase RuvA
VISGIEGTIINKEPDHCELLTGGGVIYRLFISLNTFSTLGSTQARLLTSLIVREDALVLYGFATAQERTLFEMLLKVSGVGPKSALAICSTFTPEGFAQVIADRSEAQLIKVPGIGKKSAGLILVQLSGSIDALASAGLSGNHHREAASALENLGFKPADISKVLSRCEASDTASLIKEALKLFQK